MDVIEPLLLLFTFQIVPLQLLQLDIAVSLFHCECVDELVNPLLLVNKLVRRHLLLDQLLHYAAHYFNADQRLLVRVRLHLVNLFKFLIK